MSSKTDYTQFNNPELAKMRHTAEHLLHDAARLLWPHIQLAMGPATDEGFYCDFDPIDELGASFKVSEADFDDLLQKMQWLKALDLPITKEEISFETARVLFADNPYKLDTIDRIEERGDVVSVYWTGDKELIQDDLSKLSNGYYLDDDNFVSVDLCGGPHVESTGRVGEFTLLSVAGAYWQGDENNKMLTRIYGTAFETKQELEGYSRTYSHFPTKLVVGYHFGLPKAHCFAISLKTMYGSCAKKKAMKKSKYHTSRKKNYLKQADIGTNLLMSYSKSKRAKATCLR